MFYLLDTNNRVIARSKDLEAIVAASKGLGHITERQEILAFGDVCETGVNQHMVDAEMADKATATASFAAVLAISNCADNAQKYVAHARSLKAILNYRVSRTLFRLTNYIQVCI